MAKARRMYDERFKEYPICEVPECISASSQPHHHTILKRNGDGLFQFRCLCIHHHDWIHFTNPRLARKQGLLDCLTEQDWTRQNGGRT